jgi:hypothetical protein
VSTELEQLRARIEQLENSRRRLSLIVGVVAAGWLLSVPLKATNAWAATCAQTLPSPMVTFCPDSPALASEANGNFQQIITWLTQKVGAVGTANINTTGPIYKGAVVPNTADLGLYSQTSGNYLRLVSNAAPINLYTDGNATNAWIGGATPALSMGSDGSATVKADLIVNGNAWGAVNQQAYVNKSPLNIDLDCPGGQYVCGISFRHPVNQNLLFNEDVALRCCTL